MSVKMAAVRNLLNSTQLSTMPGWSLQVLTTKVEFESQNMMITRVAGVLWILPELTSKALILQLILKMLLNHFYLWKIRLLHLYL